MRVPDITCRALWTHPPSRTSHYASSMMTSLSRFIFLLNRWRGSPKLRMAAWVKRNGEPRTSLSSPERTPYLKE